MGTVGIRTGDLERQGQFQRLFAGKDRQTDRQTDGWMGGWMDGGGNARSLTVRVPLCSGTRKRIFKMAVGIQPCEMIYGYGSPKPA